MPKMKTHSGAKKRFKVTKSGKIKRKHAYTSHLLSAKSRKQKRNLRKISVIDERNERSVKTLLAMR